MAALPSGLSYTQKEVPTADQLMHREQDPMAALLAFAVNSGQHRFQEIMDLAAAGAVDPAAEDRFREELEAEYAPSIQGEVYEHFMERYNIEAPLLACAACGVRQIVHDPSTVATKQLAQLSALRYTEKQVADLLLLPTAYRPAVSHYEYGQDYYHVHQDLVHFPDGTDQPHVEICLSCWKDIQYNKLPKYAIANGVDFGSASRLQLPTLTLVEQYLIARSIVFISLVKLNSAALAEAQTGKRGHVITFPHQGPADLAEHTTVNAPTVFPNLDAVYTNVIVCFVGAKPAYDAFVPDRRGRITELQVRKEPVYQWLQALKALHPLYGDIEIDNSETMGQNLDAITATLWQDALVLTNEDTLAIEKVVEAERLSHRPFGMDEELPAESAESAAGPEWPPLPSVMVTKMPHVNPATLPPVTSVCAAVARALETAPPAVPLVPDVEFPLDGLPVELDASAREPPADVAPLLIQRSALPLNEFTENDRLFYSAFPFVFFLGRGLQQAGSVPEAAFRHLMQQYTNAGACCARLLHLLFDQRQRHATTVQTAVYVRANPGSFQAFAEMQADPTFLAQLREAAQYPNRPASIALAKRVLKVVAVVAPKIPFTSAARKASMPKLLSLRGCFGLPSVFLTFAPDDTHGVLNLRLSLPSTSNQTFPAIDDHFLEHLKQGQTISHGLPVHGKALLARLASGPVPAAEIFRQLVHAVFTDILGLPPVTGTRQTTLLANRRPGLLGTPLAAFGCVEEQARGSPHIHIVYWGGLSPELLQAIATTPLLVELVKCKLDHVFNGTARPVAQLEAILRRRLGAPFQRPALYRPHHPLHEPELFQQDVDRAAASVQIHKHERTCHKPPAGRKECRLGRPAPQLPATRVVQIVPQKTAEGQSGFAILEDIQPAVRRMPATPLDLLKPDPRLIIYELRRPALSLQSSGGDKPEDQRWTIVCGDATHPVPDHCAAILNTLSPDELLRLQQQLSARNGLVVEYNGLLSTLLGCNTNVSPLGSAAQAKAILCYLLLYVTKTTNEVAQSLGLLHAARHRVDLFPSAAEDRDTPQRQGRLYLHRLLNDISGRDEISSTMMALCLLGGEAEVFTHKFFYAFVDAAIQYGQRRRQPITGPTMTPAEDEEGAGDLPTEQSATGEGPDLTLDYDFHVPLEMPITVEGAPEPTLHDTSAPIYRSGDSSTPVHQHEHYALRGPELRHFSLFEYTAVINVIPLAPTPAVDEEAAGPSQTRKRNATFRFAPSHPLYASHHQQLRSQLRVPVPVSKPAVPPPDNVDQNNEAWQRLAQGFAEYYLVLLRPWSADDGTRPGPLSWLDFTQWLAELQQGSDGGGPSLLDRTRLGWLRNMAAGLRVPSPDRTAVQKFRCRAATRWASQTAEERLDQEVERRHRVLENEDLTTAEAEIEFLRAQAHADDRESGAAIEEALYERATLGHLATAAADLPPSSAPLLPADYEPLLFRFHKEQGLRNKQALEAPPPPPAPLAPPCPPESPALPTDSPHPPLVVEVEDSLVRGLNAEQRDVFDRCATYFRHHRRATLSGDEPPPPFRICLHGGPGTGKTYLSNAIVQAAQKAGYAVSCVAPTGIAAAGLPAGRTVHNFLGVGLLNRDDTHEYLPAPTDARLAEFRREHDAARLRLLVIDEISNLQPSLFGQLENQLQSLIPGGSERLFGGLAVLITGDFFQLPPVGTSHALYEPFGSFPASERPAQHAASLFAGFHLVDLHQQMRAAEDPAHGAMLDRLRWPVGQQSRVDLNYIRSLKVLSADDVRNDPSWATAPVIVSSNHMRRAVNDAVSRSFARLHGQHRFIWRTPLTGSPACFFTKENEDYMYERYPGLTGFFVRGAPALLTSNTNPGLGLANGTAVIMHSLALDDKEDHATINDLLRRSEPTDIPLKYQPTYIAVRVPQPTEALQRVPGGSLCPEEDGIVAVHPVQARNPDKHRVTLGSLKIPALLARPHALDPAFSLTVHKIQGQTCDKLIIDLNKTPIRPALTFQGLVVLLSRVRSSENLRLLPPPITVESPYQHLLKLEPPKKLIDWLQRVSSSASTSGAAPTAPPPPPPPLYSGPTSNSGRGKFAPVTDPPLSLNPVMDAQRTFFCRVPGRRRRPAAAPGPALTPAPGPAPAFAPVPASGPAPVSGPALATSPLPASAATPTSTPACASAPRPESSTASTTSSSTATTEASVGARRTSSTDKGKAWKKPRRDAP